ncbi:hypothetical protein ACFXKC_53395 [Streptomyces sp. NPDC059340]|uniref:hypothetical protein n=1 Tax=Streptomyces sp. NPDC059340 TaxID=3346806 RepID=UPI0036B56B63
MGTNRHRRTALILLAGLAAGPAPLAAIVTTAHAAAADCPQNDTQCEENDKDQKETAKERQEVNDSTKKAKDDIAEAQTQVDKCKAKPADCTKDLAGDGAEEKEGIKDTKDKLDAFKDTRTTDASTAIDGTCDVYAATLPVSGADAKDLTELCEVMSR